MYNVRMCVCMIKRCTDHMFYEAIKCEKAYLVAVPIHCVLEYRDIREMIE